MKQLLLLFVLLLTFHFNCSSILNEEQHEEEEHENETYDEFDALLQKTNSQLNDSLTAEAFQLVLNALNENCLNSTQIFTALDVQDGLNEERFIDASILLAHRMKTRHHDDGCDDDKTDLNITAKTVFDAEEVCRRDIAALIQVSIDNEKFTPSSKGEKCFGSANILSECTRDQATIDDAVKKLVIAMASGACFLPEPAFFQESVLEYLRADKQGRVTEKNFEKLLEKFSLGGRSNEDDHGHEEDHHDDDVDDHNDDSDDHDDDRDVDHNNNHHNDDGGEHDDDDDDHSMTKRSAEEDDHEDEENHDDEKDHGDEQDHDDEKEHSNEENKCFSPSQLLTIAGQNRDENGSLILTEQGLINICPAIIQQFITGACQHRGSPTDPERPTAASTYTQAQKYGYGTLAVLIISLLAFGGLLLFPTIGSVSYKMTMQFFIALGVGTLSGDALLHLIPEVVGLHGHEAGDDGHGHEEEEEEDQSYIFKLLVVVVGIYVFYLFENILRVYNQISKKNLSLHAHHHDSRKHSHSAPGKEASHNHMMTRASISIATAVNGTNHFLEENGEVKAASESDVESSNPNAVCCGVTPVGIMVFIGDALHNFGDGLALGVAFSSSIVAGIGASIAIFCHELPHEFGDFAIYLKNGMTKWQGLGMNFLAACCAFIGLYIGLSVSENEDARQWMLAVIAGMFLYIALVDVLHEMIEEVSEDHPILMFFLQNIGLCLGWTILLLLALYEESIANVFG